MSTKTAAGELTAVTCADCGRPGLEHETDPMPGVCARCMDRRLLGVAAGLSHDVLHGLTGARTLRNHYRRLLDVGMLPAAASKDVRTLADAFGYPVPKEALASADAGWERRVAAYVGAQEETVRAWRRAR